MKNFLILFPYPFTEFEYYKYEIQQLKKNYKCNVIVHDLSYVLSNKKLIEVWKTKKSKKAKRFKSILSWIKELKKINKNTIIFDLVDLHNFNTLIIKIILKLSKLKIMNYEYTEVAFWKPNTSLNYFIKKITEHKFNWKIYLFTIKSVIFRNLIKLVNFKSLYLFTHNKNEVQNRNKYLKVINCHAYDYSNTIINKKKYINYNKKNKFIVYLDSPAPYFSGDIYLNNANIPLNDVDYYYKELNLFFDKLEKLFGKKIIIIPHPKYKKTKLKKKNINPYFCNRITDNTYDAASKLIPDSFFIITGRTTTAISYGIIHSKPIQVIYSSNYNYLRTEFEDMKVLTKKIGGKLVDISIFDKKAVRSNLKINKSKYESYKYKYLTYKNNKNKAEPNYKIIGDSFRKN